LASPAGFEKNFKIEDLRAREGVAEGSPRLRPNIGEDASLLRPNMGEDASLRRPNMGEDVSLRRPNMGEGASFLRLNIGEDAPLLDPYIGASNVGVTARIAIEAPRVSRLADEPERLSFGALRRRIVGGTTTPPQIPSACRAGDPGSSLWWKYMMPSCLKLPPLSCLGQLSG
jgi:hypothetical protein